ncbi:MAG TPA: peptidylprolyl isomerase [Steroidobacteraceae bacterium]|nr:peptidylprolyl isomerase [Steroidobacteraceae bacterium]
MTHRLNRKTAALGLLAPLVLLAACNKAATPAAEAPAERVATVNGKPVPKSEFDLYIANMSRQAGRDVTEEQKGEMLDQYIKMQLAAEEAEKGGIEKDPKVRDQLALARLQVLLEAGMQKYLDSHPVDDSELRPEYDRQVAALPREYHARHILVDDQAAAEAITKELEKGADFAKLAAKRSKDSTGKSGGDLGWFTLDSMVKPFSDAVRTLAPGELTKQPVKSEFGWHVIKLEESRASSAPPFEEVKDRVKTLVQRKKLQTHLDELVKAAKIEKTGATAAPAAAPAAKTEEKDKKESG